MELSLINGIGTKYIELLNKLNIYNIEDLLTYYPYRYNIYRLTNNLISNETINIKGVIESIPITNYFKRNFNRLNFRCLINNQLINVVIFNRAFLKPKLTLGREIILTGKYDHLKHNFVASNILLDKLNTSKVESVYHLINGLTNNNISNFILKSLIYSNEVTDYIPKYLVNKYNFIDKSTAIKEIHLPSNNLLLKQSKLRLIYEEFFKFMFKINYLKNKYTDNINGISRNVDFKLVEEFINSLSFKLTTDQDTAVHDIYNEMISHKRMNRLVLGDVGSGKTIVSFIAIYINYLSHMQSALMAPTEILARQHYNNIKEVFKNYNLNIALLVGSMTKKEKQIIIDKLSQGEIDVIIGTHSIISDNVNFKNLGLVITDEQHRFGVNQRSNLQNKGHFTDVLYLSATPIPRTLALTIYGDMDTSFIKTKPSGRKEIITKVKKESELKEVLFKCLECIKNNHQIYVVAPLIESDDDLDLNNIYLLKEKFNMAFQNKINIGILHGKMKKQEKEEVMEDYKKGIIKILISTTVIEVGVDVKNSTMMIIFNAERFGLATLHQLRGRVGRNDLQSYCYLICNQDIKRLQVMEESNDGFYISEKDFELRGQGDLFGTEQSGDMVFKIGDLQKDYKILMQTKIDSLKFIEDNISNNFLNYPKYKSIVNSITFLD